MTMRNLVATACLGAILAGCTMAPNYTRPTFAAAPDWPTITGYELPQGADVANQLSWQKFFSDPALHKVIETALENNKNLKQSALNIAEARAQYRITRADLVPSINANGSMTKTSSSEKSNLFGTGKRKTTTYEAGLGVVAYEFDLFGRIRSQSNAAINEYLSTKEAYAVVRNALIAETANAYLQLLADQKLLTLTEKTLEAQQHSYDLLQESLKQGVADKQDVARAATAVETAQVNYHQYIRFVAQDKNALFLLMGIPQDPEKLTTVSLDDVKLPELRADLPSSVLLLRPDIRQAEYQLMARNADIGAARAAFFPSISLTGNYGFASTNLSGLFTSGAWGAWSFMPQVSLPIFQGGRNRANLSLANVRKQKGVLQYEQAIQTAFREVADELAARATIDEQLAAQRRLVAAAQEVYDIAEARYDSGLDSFLSVLDAQRELYAFQQAEIETERQKLANLVNLYKALGGGTEREVIKKLDSKVTEPIDAPKTKKGKNKAEAKPEVKAEEAVAAPVADEVQKPEETKEVAPEK